MADPLDTYHTTSMRPMHGPSQPGPRRSLRRKTSHMDTARQVLSIGMASHGGLVRPSDNFCRRQRTGFALRENDS
jgi:hypothetical protein